MSMVYSYIQQHGLVSFETVINSIFCFQKKNGDLMCHYHNKIIPKSHKQIPANSIEYHMVSITKPVSRNHAYNSSLHGGIISGKSI